MATEADTPTINGIDIKEGREFVLTEDNQQLGEMAQDDNIDPDAGDEPTMAAPLGAGTTLTIEEYGYYPDGLNVTFETAFGSITLVESGVASSLESGLLKPVEETDQRQ
jgi:hypothetical protein